MRASRNLTPIILMLAYLVVFLVTLNYTVPFWFSTCLVLTFLIIGVFVSIYAVKKMKLVSRGEMKAILMALVAGSVIALAISFFFANLLYIAKTMLVSSSISANSDALNLVIVLASNNLFVSILTFMGFSGTILNVWHREIEKQALQNLKKAQQAQNFLEGVGSKGYE